MSFDQLPDELVYRILANVDCFDDLSSAAGTCSLLFRIVNDHRLLETVPLGLPSRTSGSDYSIYLLRSMRFDLSVRQAYCLLFSNASTSMWLKLDVTECTYWQRVGGEVTRRLRYGSAHTPHQLLNDRSGDTVEQTITAYDTRSLTMIEKTITLRPRVNQWHIREGDDGSYCYIDVFSDGQQSHHIPLLKSHHRNSEAFAHFLVEWEAEARRTVAQYGRTQVMCNHQDIPQEDVKKQIAFSVLLAVLALLAYLFIDF